MQYSSFGVRLVKMAGVSAPKCVENPNLGKRSILYIKLNNLDTHHYGIVARKFVNGRLWLVEPQAS